MMLIGGVILVIIIGVIIWRIRKKEKFVQPTPEEQKCFDGDAPLWVKEKCVKDIKWAKTENTKRWCTNNIPGATPGQIKSCAYGINFALDP